LLFFYFVQWSLKLLRAFYRKIHRRINQKIYPQNNPKPFRPDLLPHCTTQQPQPRLNTPLSQINQKIYQPKAGFGRKPQIVRIQPFVVRTGVSRPTTNPFKLNITTHWTQNLETLISTISPWARRSRRPRKSGGVWSSNWLP
jgi:hypothetical protein